MQDQGTQSALKSVLIVVGAVLLLLIVFQNTQIVQLRFLFWRFRVSQILLVFVCVLIGLTLGYLFGTFTRSRQGRE